MKQSMEKFEKEQEKQRENEPEQGKKDGSEKSVIDDEAENRSLFSSRGLANIVQILGRKFVT